MLKKKNCRQVEIGVGVPRWRGEVGVLSDLNECFKFNSHTFQVWSDIPIIKKKDYIL